jgi:hypothetical protein
VARNASHILCISKTSHQQSASGSQGLSSCVGVFASVRPIKADELHDDRWGLRLRGFRRIDPKSMRLSCRAPEIG